MRTNGATSPLVAVIGSCNLDITVPVDELPSPGQTVLGGDALRTPGGKGANQAVAAARLGAAVELIGRVGDDDVGDALRASLRAEGVGTAHVMTTAGVPSGVALITVEASGENTIAVSPGANARLSGHDVADSLEASPGSPVILLQLEIPLEAVASAICAANGLVVLNPAPARTLAHDLLDRVDVLVPNRTELGILAGAQTPDRLGDVEALARTLDGPGAVVVTLGAEGALVVADGRAVHVPAPRVRAVDTTGAGDAFCGALATSLSAGETVVDATRWAVRVAGMATTAWGAQTALPTREQVESGMPPPGDG